MRYGFVQANTDRAFHVDEISYRVIAFLGVVRFPVGIAFQGRFYRVLSVINARVQPMGAILRRGLQVCQELKGVLLLVCFMGVCPFRNSDLLRENIANLLVIAGDCIIGVVQLPLCFFKGPLLPLLGLFLLPAALILPALLFLGGLALFGLPLCLGRLFLLLLLEGFMLGLGLRCGLASFGAGFPRATSVLISDFR